jgi:hypothetical protein
MVRVLCLCCVEAALWFLLVALTVDFCNGPPGGVVVVRHGADMDPSALVTAVPAAINLWRVAAVALAAVVTRRGTKFLASALPPREGAAGTAGPPAGAS